MKRIIIIAMAILNSFGWSFAQPMLTEKEAVDIILTNHPAIEAGAAKVRQQQRLAKAPAAWDPTEIYHNIAADPDLGAFGTSTIGAVQRVPSRRFAQAQRQLHQRSSEQANATLAHTRQELIREVRELYRHLSYLESRKLLLVRLDSLYQSFASIAASRYRAGEGSMLEQRLAQDKAQHIRLELQTISHETAFDQQVLGQILGLESAVTPVIEPFKRMEFSLSDTALVINSALSTAARLKIDVAQAQTATEKARLSPVFFGGLSAQYLANGLWFPGYQVGLHLPLFRKGWQDRIESTAVDAEVAQAEYRQTLLQQQTALSHLLHEIEKYEALIGYYENQGRLTADELLRSGRLNYQQGEIDYVAFIQIAEQAIDIEMNYLENLYGLNLTVVEILFLIN